MKLLHFFLTHCCWHAKKNSGSITNMQINYYVKVIYLQKYSLLCALKNKQIKKQVQLRNNQTRSLSNVKPLTSCENHCLDCVSSTAPLFRIKSSKSPFSQYCMKRKYLFFRWRMEWTLITYGCVTRLIISTSRGKNFTIKSFGACDPLISLHAKRCFLSGFFGSW